MYILSKIDPQWFIFDVFLVAFIAWLAGSFLFKIAHPQGQKTPHSLERISTEGFGRAEWIGSLVVVIFYSSNVWVRFLLPPEDLEGGDAGPATLIIGLFVQFVLPSIIMLSILGAKVNLLDSLGLRNVNWGKAAALALGGFLITLFLLVLLSVSPYEQTLQYIFGELPDQAAVGALKNAEDPIDLTIMIIAAVVLAPIFEEILFRSFLYTATKKYTGPIFSIIVSSLIFSTVHGSVSAFIPLCVIGAILAIVYELSGSIWTNIFVHAAFNLFNVAMLLTFG